ncbi:MAG: hypothetical protein GWM98_22705 [Nitrospinaceae bacterium]|nr:hypothetical protein [Nitrospinaceae bacterium]NIR56750.1 hypothetical protein [Nitrospinaceae bacterium]NIS87199.1 hypothetical protein [Nitrospinaceae bacterium]NIT84068.1 hypothetical protein [Nitrospinaceae bacterium]NIU46251.1 hypothetical protein [Nitrospinaceae bacterium]
MFYEVKILDKEGKVKKVVSSKSLSNKFWKRNNDGKEFTGNLSMEEDEFEYGANWNIPGPTGTSSVKTDDV